MSHAPRALAALLFALFLGACSQHSLFVDDPEAAQMALPHVSVVQADALIINGQRVHLVDAVTPQAAPDARCPAEALAARQARLRVMALADRVKHIDVRTTGTLDGYNRADAHILFDGVDPASVLIDEGLAVAPQKQAFDWCGPLSAAYPRAQHVALLSLAGS